MMAFYLLPARAWELLIGSLTAWVMLRYQSLTMPRMVKLTGSTILLLLSFFPIDSIHPRGDALIVVVTTGILLIGHDDWLPLNFMTRSIIKIGDWSYSLYLVHWPLLAFVHLAYLGKIPNYIMWVLLFLSLGLAYLQYQFVEQRFRYGWQANYKKSMRWLVVYSFMLILLPMPKIVPAYLNVTENSIDYEYIRRPNIGLDKTCAQGAIFVKPTSLCKTCDDPTIAVWGDSYAMSLLSGLRTDPFLKDSFVQITKAACAPIRGISTIDSKYNESWARTCVNFNERAFNYIVSQDSIKYVIFSSPWAGYFNDGNLRLLFEDKEIKGNRSFAIQKMVETIEALRQYDKQPIIIAPPPEPGFNIGDCVERHASSLFVLNHTNCDFPVDQYLDYQEHIIHALKELEQRARVDVVWMDEVLCNKDICQTVIDDICIYRDGGHLTVKGSEFIIPKLNLADRLFTNKNLADFVMSK